MNYQQTQDYIEKLCTYGSSYGLKTITELLKRLGNPQNDLKFVHIAGTNGKGSILAYTSTTLMRAGYKVGRYLSPSIFSFLERIQINEQNISKDNLAIYFSQVAPVSEAMAQEGYQHATMFETELAASLLYFKANKCDICVLETGLGGSLDATNVITTAVVSLIASISLDHTQLLGNTLTAIATEKAGIIKNSTPVVLSPQKDGVNQVFINACQKYNSQLTIVDEKDIISLSDTKDGQTFSYKNEEYQISLLGAHQLNNVACAIEGLQVLANNGFKLNSAQIKDGLKHTIWHGRFERIAQNPDFIIDGAHNPDAALRLSQGLAKYYPNQKPIYVITIFKDKDYTQILNLTAKNAKHIFATTTNNPRALSAEELAQNILPLNANVTVCPTLKEAIDKAQAIAKANDVIVSFGSLSHLGETYALVTNTTLED